MKAFSLISTINFFALLWYVLLTRETNWLLIIMAIIFGFLALTTGIMSDVHLLNVKRRENVHLNINIDNVAEVSKKFRTDLDRIEEKIAEIFS